MDESVLKELWGEIVLSELIGSYQRRELVFSDPADRRLKVSIYCEKNHSRPHVHIYWTREFRLSISISDREVLAGKMPTKNLKAVQKWIEKNELVLMNAWGDMQSGKKPNLEWIKNA